jgi:hypothetical protein
MPAVTPPGAAAYLLRAIRDEVAPATDRAGLAVVVVSAPGMPQAATVLWLRAPLAGSTSTIHFIAAVIRLPDRTGTMTMPDAEGALRLPDDEGTLL